MATVNVVFVQLNTQGDSFDVRVKFAVGAAEVIKDLHFGSGETLAGVVAAVKNEAERYYSSLKAVSDLTLGNYVGSIWNYDTLTKALVKVP